MDSSFDSAEEGPIDVSMEDFLSSKKSNNLKDYMESPDFLKELNVSVNIKKGELFLMLLKYSKMNFLTFTATKNLFKLINVMFECEILPDSRHSLDKLLNEQENAQYHAVCNWCSAYVGKYGEVSSKETCPNEKCKKELDLSNPSKSSFFVLLDPSSQIQDLMNIHGDYYNHIVKKRNYEKRSTLQDVYDGNQYKNFWNSLPKD